MRKNRLFMRSLLCLTLSASMVLSGMAMPETAWGALADNDADLLLDVDELLSDDADAEGAEALSDGQDELSEELSEDVEVLDESISDSEADPAAAEADQGNKNIAAPSEGAGVENPETDQATHEAQLNKLDELTSSFLRTFINKATNATCKNSDYIKGDFNVPQFEPIDDEEVMNYKILTTQTDKLLTYNALFNKNKQPTGEHTPITWPKNGSNIKDTWAEMLCVAFGENKNVDYEWGRDPFFGEPLTENVPEITGAYVTDLQYGTNPINAFEKAVNNDPYLKSGSDLDTSRTLNQVYASCAVRLNGYGNGIAADIRERYKDNESNPNANKPCYCAIVVNNVDSLDDKVREGDRPGNYNYFGKPYIYVLFFHDFSVEDRNADYLTTSAMQDTDREITNAEEARAVLKELGIDCDSKDVPSKMEYTSKDQKTGADLYVAENDAGTESNVSTTYSIEEGISKSVSYTSSYEKYFNTSITEGQSLSFSFEAGNAIAKVGSEIGFTFEEHQEWSYTWGSENSTSTDNTNVKTHEKSFSQLLPPYTRNTLMVQPTETTITFNYESAVSPKYQVDVLLYNPYNPLLGQPIDSDNMFKTICWGGNWSANLTNADYYKDITVDKLFTDAVVRYGKNKDSSVISYDWVKNFVDRGDGEACLLLGSLFFDRPILPYGGKFSVTQKGVKISSTDLEPTRPLSLVKPAITKIDMYEGDDYDLEDIQVSGYNGSGGLFYGFNTIASGEWMVKSGPAEVVKNSAGNTVLSSTGVGEAVIWFMPTHVLSSKLASNLDVRGITVNIVGNDGSNMEAGSIGIGNAKWKFDPKKTGTVVAVKKVDVSEKLEEFESMEGYVKDAKHRYKIDNKKAAKISKKGVLTPKKAGEINIQLEQKEKGGEWTKVGEVTLCLQVPKMQKKDTKTLTAGDTVDAFQYLAKTTFRPTKWISTKPSVASVDPETGIITAHKKGTTKIIAVYGEGSEASGKKYATTLKVKMNKNKK